MSSPDVWTDARARIKAAADALGLPVAWPNEAFPEPQPYDPASGAPLHWIAVEISGDLSEPLEIGREGVWEETGMVHLHLMIPTGSGLAAGLAQRKALANAFRGLLPAPVMYRGAIFDPSGPADEDGNWARLSLRVPYSYQDFTIPA
ncbi:DUF4128 domain-containing protein [Roseomonas xinghualingensis]|uniref:DUF4128 domain-containing protein n=1 Tax=Roseomonas xinghualingensis TaxID=2986475 RepID=UPI0021F0B433|nr:DUF4128 domain-containing protein [Roseomonas sp. SXEYE001]MCV4209895.1 DUF4128 domain-containing protein [Roseomonas sp. SXEYE001]